MPWQVIECEGGIEQGDIQRGLQPGLLGKVMVSLVEVKGQGARQYSEIREYFGLGYV